ncbi:unnamed protein product [Amaranthus hypochondriacus]
MDDFSDYESENIEALFGDFDGGEDVLMEVEALHNEVIGDLEPPLDLNSSPPLSPIANDPIENEIVRTDHNEPNDNQPNHHKPRLHNQMRQQILLHLLQMSIAGNLPHGSINKTAEQFGYSRRTISYLWNKAQKQKQTFQKINTKLRINGTALRINPYMHNSSRQMVMH